MSIESRHHVHLAANALRDSSAHLRFAVARASTAGDQKLRARIDALLDEVIALEKDIRARLEPAQNLSDFDHLKTRTL